MSTPLAIAAVTAVLKDVLNTSMTMGDLSSIVGDVKVSAKPPDKLIPANGDEQPAVNIFLYQVTPNQGWRNAGLAARDYDGNRTGNPPLALDLHYLLTATGPKDLYPEVILGYAMEILHETGVLSRDLIAKALAPVTPPADFPSQLKFSELEDQIEQIRITPASLSIDDISKLWTGFQGRYRVSTAYTVTVVLIQTPRSTRASLPVVSRNIAVKPFQQIVIDNIATVDGGYAVAGSTLLITGSKLDDSNFSLLIDGVDATTYVTAKSATSVTVKLPDPIGDVMRAGAVAVQIQHPVEFAAGILRSGPQSDLVPVVLHPTVAVNVDGAVDGVITLKIRIDPKVTKTQRLLVLLNDVGPGAQAYSFAAPGGNGIADPLIDTDTVFVKCPGVVSATYLVRVSVDGVESALTMTAGIYSSPTVAL